MFCRKEAVVHSAAFSRAAEVRETATNGFLLAAWASDRYSAQQGQAQRQQNRLAQLDRKVRFAASTLHAKRRSPERDRDTILRAPANARSRKTLSLR